MKKNILLVLYMLLIWAVITLGLKFVFPNQPLNGKADCGNNYIFKDETSPFEYDGDSDICRVQVKAGSQVQGEACYGLTVANPSNACYSASGLGTTHVKVNKVGGDECKDISHVEFYACPKEPTDTPTSTKPPPTETFTPTSIATDPVDSTKTPTATVETPFKFWSPTPITITPTSAIITITSTPMDFPTPNTAIPSNTVPPVVKNTKTPVVLLPSTGFVQPVTDSTEIMARIGLAFVVIVLLWVVIRAIQNIKR